jgi:hypothetical protein
MPLQVAPDLTRRGDGPPSEESLTGGDSTEIEVNPRCCLCGTDAELSYCTFCGKHFCAGCERNYPARVIAATMEGFTALKDFLLNALPVERTVPRRGATPEDRPCCGKGHLKM